MNYNFTEAVRRTLGAAREEALGLRHDYVGTEHMLLGLIRNEEVVGILGRLGVRPEMIAGGVHVHVRPGRSTVAVGELPYTSRAKKVLEFCMSEAREAGDDHVGPKHLLLGLIREEKGIAAEVLVGHGVTLERARAASAGVEPPALPTFHIRIDDASDLSIYEQIVAQVTEGIATGALQPGERLPTVRQLADTLDVAPGTVSRAYGELERQNRIVTEGARGTRVAERIGTPRGAADRRDTLAGLLRPVAVAAFHLGGTAEELRAALEEAMRGIFDRAEDAA